MLEQITERIADRIAPRLAERRNQLERLANLDELTQLPNRRAFELARATAEKQGLAFIIYDLNNFGLVNKSYSHADGDRALQYYANVLANVSAKYKARAFRYGGDEAVMIVPKQFAVQIRDAVEKRALPMRFDGFTVSISGEIGMTVEQADETLQRRKAERKAQDAK